MKYLSDISWTNKDENAIKYIDNAIWVDVDESDSKGNILICNHTTCKVIKICIKIRCRIRTFLDLC